MTTTPDRYTVTEKQLAALKALSATRFESAHSIGVSGAVLTTLANRKLVDRKMHTSSLRGGDVWTYRISGLGCVALGRAKRAEAGR